MPGWRNENKYVVTDAQLAVLRARLDALIPRDPHQKGQYYRIRSLYCDDIGDSAFSENEAGTDDRAKFRIRYYGDYSGRLTLECKQKSHGKCLKEACPLPETIFNGLSGFPSPLPGPGFDRVLNRFLLERQTRMLGPKAVIEYERSAWVYAPGNVRITFDRNISVSTETHAFTSGSFRRLPVLAPGEHVLEVKWDELIPGFIWDALETGTLRMTTFSKYYLGRLAVMELEGNQ